MWWSNVGIGSSHVMKRIEGSIYKLFSLVINLYFTHLIRHPNVVVIQTTIYLNLLASRRLHILTPICYITSVFTGMLWNFVDIFIIFPCFWYRLHLPIKYSVSLSISCRKIFSHVFCWVLYPIHDMKPLFAPLSH